MRVGVLDIGSNSAQLQVVDVRPGAPPLPAHSVKAPTLLGEEITPDGAVSPEGVDRVTAAEAEAVAAAHRLGVDELYSFATSAVRDATNRDADPEFALSLPVGAGRLTRAFLHHDPPARGEVKALRRHVRETLRREGPPRMMVATSKTFEQLARLAGAPPQRDGRRSPCPATRRSATWGPSSTRTRCPPWRPPTPASSCRCSRWCACPTAPARR